MNSKGGVRMGGASTKKIKVKSTYGRDGRRKGGTLGEFSIRVIHAGKKPVFNSERVRNASGVLCCIGTVGDEDKIIN